MRKRVRILGPAAWLAGLGLLLFPAAALADGDGAAPGSETDVVEIGLQDVEVDAEDGRDARFDRNSEFPSGLVVDFLRWSYETDDNWVQIKAWDATQLDERIVLEAGFGPKVRFRADYQSLPHRYGSGARLPLGRQSDDSFGATFRIGDFVQQQLQDPDGNGVDFYLSSAETAGDNALVQGLTNDLLAGTSRFGLASRRKTGGVGVTFDGSDRWTFRFDARRDTRDGTQPLGSGTYQRITDVNGDGTTDYDYFFSVRGIELPGLIDHETTRVQGGANYRGDRWFLDLTGSVSEFDNEYRAITYDNPFWFDGVVATSGSRRGLWEEGRVSLEPSNEAWDVGATGGVRLGGHTTITASLSIGQHSQDDLLLPITTNPATVGTEDINRDGTVNGLDDPTLTIASISGVPSTIDGMRVVGSTLDAESDTTAFTFTFVSRPNPKLTVTGRYRMYEYEGQEGIQVIPARTEYNESRVKLDFKGDLILHVPGEFERQTVGGEVAYRISPAFRIAGFATRKSYDYPQYRDPDMNSTRDSGTRAVSGTDDDQLGVKAWFAGGEWLSGRVTLLSADREFNGSYTTAFSGELGTVRQYDIANRDREGATLQLDFMPSDRVTVGFGFETYEDDYKDSIYGVQGAEQQGATLSLNYVLEGGTALYAFADMSEWDADMHLRTKCSNCSTPPGFSPWDVPNYDWFVDYMDESVALGGGVSHEGERTRVAFNVSLIDAEVETLTQNPGTPVELNPANPLFGTTAGVALAENFPVQENKLLRTELEVSRRFSERVAAGLRWLYEDFELTDFQWDDLDPYGANFLVVDDATRYLFLDSRYGDYDAHILQVFMRIGL